MIQFARNGQGVCLGSALGELAKPSGSREVSESGIRAVWGYDCPTAPCIPESLRAFQQYFKCHAAGPRNTLSRSRGGGRPLGIGRQLPPLTNCWKEAPWGGGGMGGGVIGGAWGGGGGWEGGFWEGRRGGRFPGGGGPDCSARRRQVPSHIVNLVQQGAMRRRQRLGFGSESCLSATSGGLLITLLPFRSRLSLTSVL